MLEANYDKHKFDYENISSDSSEDEIDIYQKKMKKNANQYIRDNHGNILPKSYVPKYI